MGYTRGFLSWKTQRTTPLFRVAHISRRGGYTLVLHMDSRVNGYGFTGLAGAFGVFATRVFPELRLRWVALVNGRLDGVEGMKVAFRWDKHPAPFACMLALECAFSK